VELLDDVLRWAQNAAFVTVALWALARFRRDGDDQTRWVAATFGALGTTVVIGALSQLAFAGEPPSWLQRVSVVVLLSFPYLLVRFLGTFEPVPSAAQRTLGWVVLAQVVAGAVVPLDAEEVGAMPSARAVFVVVVVGTWLVALPYVGVRFWRAGRGRPTLVRRRLRLLGVAVVALSLALLLAAAGSGEAGDPVAIVTQTMALASALSFVLGFATPRGLRRWWRQEEERQLYDAAVSLLSTTSVDEVAAVLLPRLRRVVSARAAALVHRGGLVAADGLGEGEERELRAGQLTGGRRTELTRGVLLVWVDPYAPFFGAGEREVLERTGLLADLALHRAELLASEQAARRSLEETNTELESFVYSASHDLKSPLIAMLSYVDLLSTEHRDALGEEGRWYLERMASNGEYMESLIQDLLELSRVGRMETQPERVELASTVGTVAGEVVGQHPGFTAELGALPVVWMNGVRARQLFANLLENAAKHGGGEAVRVEVRAEEGPDGAVVVSVIDDGPGVPAAYRERVFGVFERLETDAGTGTGIGLAICRKIVEGLGGRIWLADRDDGAEFRVSFPPDVVLERPIHPEEVPA
jgi:signal transduction histidine kinase